MTAGGRMMSCNLDRCPDSHLERHRPRTESSLHAYILKPDLFDIPYRAVIKKAHMHFAMYDVFSLDTEIAFILS